MSTFGFLLLSSMILGFSFWRIWKDSSAADRSSILFPGVFFMFPSSLRTSCGMSQVIFSDVICSAISAKSIFCFVQVRTKFVSSSIFMWILSWQHLNNLFV